MGYWAVTLDGSSRQQWLKTYFTHCPPPQQYPTHKAVVSVYKVPMKHHIEMVVLDWALGLTLFKRLKQYSVLTLLMRLKQYSVLTYWRDWSSTQYWPTEEAEAVLSSSQYCPYWRDWSSIQYWPIEETEAVLSTDLIEETESFFCVSHSAEACDEGSKAVLSGHHTVLLQHLILQYTDGLLHLSTQVMSLHLTYIYACIYMYTYI